MPWLAAPSLRQYHDVTQSLGRRARLWFFLCVSAWTLVSSPFCELGSGDLYETRSVAFGFQQNIYLDE